MAALKTVPTILEDYQMEADAYRRAQEERLEADPLLARLNDQIRELGMEKLQRAIDGQSAELLDERLGQLEARRVARIDSLGIKTYRCEACKDTGIDGDSYCRCLRARIYKEHYGAYDPLASSVTLDTYDFSIFERVPKHKNSVGDTQEDIAHFAYDICDTILKELPGKTQGLFLHGRPGLGKSWLIAALARQAAEKGIDTAFIHAVPMFDAYHKERLGYPMQMQYLESARLLIVDDLGAEPMTTNVTTEALLRLLTFRKEHGLPSVFVTNQTDIQIRYGERIASRMHDINDFADLNVHGVDLRDPVNWTTQSDALATAPRPKRSTKSKS